MTQPIGRVGLLCLLALGLAGCGKYGPPVRSAVSASAGSGVPAASGGAAVHPADCRDPAHGHPADEGAGGDPEGGAQEDAP